MTLSWVVGFGVVVDVAVFVTLLDFELLISLVQTDPDFLASSERWDSFSNNGMIVGVLVFVVKDWEIGSVIDAVLVAIDSTSSLRPPF